MSTDDAPGQDARSLKAENLRLRNKRLRLQNEELRKKAARPPDELGLRLAQVEKFIPLATTALAILGLAFSAWQFGVTQRRDREKQAEAELRAEMDALLKASSEEEPHSSEVRLRLENIADLTRDKPEKVRLVTDILTKIVIYDYLDAEEINAARARFDNVANDYWDDYRREMEQDPASN